MNSLASRIALVSVVLVALAVLMAVGGAFLLGQRVADSAVTSSLSASQSVQRYLQQATAREVALTSDLLAADPHFTAYLVEAIRGGLDGDQDIDFRSLLDQIDARRQEMGFDFSMLLDVDGEILVRTDRPRRPDESRASLPMVARVMDDLIPEYGPWREGDQLYNAAVVPVTTAFELVGFLVSGMLIDRSFASDIKQVTGVDVVFLTLDQDAPRAVASTLDNQRTNTLVQASSAQVNEALARGEAIERIDLNFDSEQWTARAEPLQDGAGSLLGAVITVDSLDARLAGHRTIQTTLVVAGLAAVLIAWLLSILVARRIARPVSALADIADQAAQGEYHQTIDIDRADEVGTLARALSRLLGDLREQQEIAGYVSELSRQLESDQAERDSELKPDRSQIGESRSGEACVVAVEWRPAQALSEQAAVAALRRSLPVLTRWAEASGATLAPGGGARIYLTFFEQQPHAGLINCLASLARTTAALDPMPAMALAQGEVVTGTLGLSETTSPIISGRPVFHCERLLAEAGSARLLISPPACKVLREHLEAAGAQISLTRGRISEKSFYQLERWPRSDGAQTESVPPRTDITTSHGSVVVPGVVLGERYEILEQLGTGAMGMVYKARDRKLGDVVALKMLSPALLTDPDYLERMKSEIRLARKITHPNVLRTHDLWELDGQPIISMEYVRGIALNQLLDNSGRLKLAAGLRVCSQVLQGLSAAHRAGVLHRDIKPANILLDQSGNARLMDFGIARQVIAGSTNLTQPGTIIGTANYLSPEAALGREVDERSDLYAMGVMMFEIFTGQLPFSGDSSTEVCMAHVQQQPPSPASLWPDIPADLDRIILTCLAKKPEQRHASAEALLADLIQVRRQSAAATGSL